MEICCSFSCNSSGNPVEFCLEIVPVLSENVLNLCGNRLRIRLDLFVLLCVMCGLGLEILRSCNSLREIAEGFV